MRPAVAVVGTRKPTPEGRVAAGVIARSLSAYPITLISGLAEGIDAEAHRLTLQEGIVNIAFLGHGIDLYFPSETTSLRYQIIGQHGAVATEYFPRERYQKQYFVERNRLQAALADIVIPVQANTTGGTAHTVRFARKYKRPLIGIGWPGANGLLDHLRADGTPVPDITTRAGKRFLDSSFRELAESAGVETYALSRAERFIRTEAASRLLRQSDFSRLFETLTDLSRAPEHGQ
jgi:DNA protecting protein DprA